MEIFYNIKCSFKLSLNIFIVFHSLDFLAHSWLFNLVIFFNNILYAMINIYMKISLCISLNIYLKHIQLLDQKIETFKNKFLLGMLCFADILTDYYLPFNYFNIKKLYIRCQIYQFFLFRVLPVLYLKWSSLFLVCTYFIVL